MAYIACSSENLGRQDIRHTPLCPPLCAHRPHRSYGRMAAFLIKSLQRTAAQIFHWRTQPAGHSDLFDYSNYFGSWLWLWSLTCVSSWPVGFNWNSPNLNHSDSWVFLIIILCTTPLVLIILCNYLLWIIWICFLLWSHTGTRFFADRQVWGLDVDPKLVHHCPPVDCSKSWQETWIHQTAMISSFLSLRFACGRSANTNPNCKELISIFYTIPFLLIFFFLQRIILLL